MKRIKEETLLDDTSKKGLCFFELRRAGMAQWGISQCSTGKDDNPPLSSSIVKKEEEEEVDDKEAAKAELALLTPDNRKRKRAARRGGSADQRKGSHLQTRKQNKLDKSKDRWSAERYTIAEKNMYEVMKAEGAVFESPISRPALRMAARKCIGDTGLLDHLLKHIDGRVAPGGTERFRRCYNTSGVMEYWLESAELVNIRQETGMLDPNWVPPSWFKADSSTIQDSASAEEVKLLKAEMDNMKRDMQELISKQPEQDKSNPIEVKLLKAEMNKMKRDMEELVSKQKKSNQIEEMCKELAKWKAKTDKELMQVSASLSGVQDMHREMITWKDKIDQQLTEISNSMNSRQASKQCMTTFSPSASERWEDWLESTSLDIEGDDLASWLGNTDLVNIGPEAIMQDPPPAPPPQLQPGESPSEDPFCAGGLELFKEEMAKMKRDVLELVPRKQEEDQATVTPDSSVTGNSKLDVDNSLVLFQEMFKELAKWKAKIEQQMMEISNSVRALQASQPFTVGFNF